MLFILFGFVWFCLVLFIIVLFGSVNAFLLYYCIIVLLYYCIIVLLYYCIIFVLILNAYISERITILS